MEMLSATPVVTFVVIATDPTLHQAVLVADSNSLYQPCDSKWFHFDNQQVDLTSPSPVASVTMMEWQSLKQTNNTLIHSTVTVSVRI